ncbi:LysE family translocator [Neorhizobium galegae]|uniref:LysE family transporter n=1 Tax=Neorhizobium galegae TaxID=399 RepID=UPI0021020002|nr:LysE family transporter [Neorhizobium galegae]MCQ1774451.1 LysE family translocator [Neorhizobium galegae]
MPLLTSLALSYSLVLIAPGPNLLVVLRVAVNPSWGRLLSVAAGIASGAAIACCLAAMGTATVYTGEGLESWGSMVLSFILLYSAIRLLRHPSGSNPSRAVGSNTVNLRLYGLGLATALCNPLSIPFFVSIYIAQPDFRTGMGGVASCLIFVMALSWFTLMGRIFSMTAIRRLDPAWYRPARAILAAAMGLYAFTLLYAHSI